jgi:hypothetical protein
MKMIMHSGSLYGRKNCGDFVKNLTNEKAWESWLLFGRGNCGDFMKICKKLLTNENELNRKNFYPETQISKLK